MLSVSCVYNKLFLYYLVLLLRSDVKVANSGHAVLQWVHSEKLSVVAIMNCYYYKLQNPSIMSNHVKVWRRLQFKLSRPNCKSTVEITLCDSLYSLKFHVRVVCEQLQSNVYANSYTESWSYIIWFVIYHYKFHIIVYRSGRNQLIVNSSHHEICSILLRNASRVILICICLSIFHDNRAPFFTPFCC